VGRIKYREGGYPNEDDLIDQLIQKHGSNGANVEEVLKYWCPQFRLRWRKLGSEMEAREAISRNRVILASFYLENLGWNGLSLFYQKHPTEILDEKSFLWFSLRSVDQGISHHFMYFKKFRFNNGTHLK